jgi:3-oxoacid CoA-transferase
VPCPAEGVGAPAVEKSKGKVWDSPDEAIKDIKSGSLLLSAGKPRHVVARERTTDDVGFGLCGTAETIIEAMQRRPELKELTGVSNNAGDGVYGLGGLVIPF